MSIQGIHGYTGSTWVYRVYMGIHGIQGVHGYTVYTKYTRVYMRMDILLLLYETVGLFGVSVT